MKIFFSTLAIVLFSITVFGQNVPLPTEYIRNTLSGNNSNSENIEGSPYLNDSFQLGTVSIGNKSFESQLRYNGLKDVFELKPEDGGITELMRSTDISIKLSEADYRMYPYIDKGEIKQRYFKILNNHEGEILLLLKQSVVLNEAQKAKNTYSKDKPANFEIKEDYYIKMKDKPADEIKLRRKNILKILNDDRVEAYAKENKYRLKEENEVIEIINFFNSLLD